MPTIYPVKGGFRADVRRTGHRRLTRVFGSKAEAVRWARSIEHAMDSREHSDQRALTGVTVADLIDLWLEELTDVPRAKRSALKIMRENLGSERIATMTDTVFVRYVRDRGVAPVTWGVELSYMASLWRYAQRVWKLPLKGNPALEAREMLRMIGESGRSQQRMRRPTPGELDALKDHFRQKKRQSIPMTDLIDFAVASAMRAGEITRIRWAHLDGPSVLIEARKHPTEKESNDQRVPLLPEALKIIERQTSPKAGAIFPYKSHSIGTMFSRAVTDLGIPDLRFHDLRHEGISRLFEAGFTVPEVALFSGHRSWAMLARYTHLKPEEVARKFSQPNPVASAPTTSDATPAEPHGPSPVR
jgi:integrase